MYTIHLTDISLGNSSNLITSCDNFFFSCFIFTLASLSWLVTCLAQIHSLVWNGTSLSSEDNINMQMAHWFSLSRVNTSNSKSPENILKTIKVILSLIGVCMINQNCSFFSKIILNILNNFGAMGNPTWAQFPVFEMNWTYKINNWLNITYKSLKLCI